MELLYGVIGSGAGVAPTFNRLATASHASMPGADVGVVAGPQARIGFVARRLRSWHDPGRGRAVILDGEIRAIDGLVLPREMGSREVDALWSAYDAHGTGLFARLDGSYCLILVDGEAVHLAIDAVGARAVYWWAAGGLLAFHSHLVDAAAAYPGPLVDDYGALATFLAGGRYLPWETPFRQIRHVGAGQSLTFGRGDVVARDDLVLAFEPTRAGVPVEQLADELGDLLEESVATADRHAERPVVPLSGGLDSRYLAAELVRRNGSEAVSTVTWGEEPDRPNSDAVVAAGLARRLGVGNVWLEKRQIHTLETFDRALHLSSGEADCAIHFPDDHTVHRDLVGAGFGSMFRGDECFGATRRLLTARAVMATHELAPIAGDVAYLALLGREAFGQMSREQAERLHAFGSGLRSATATGRRDEVWYAVGVRRFLGAYNKVKHADLEVYAPLLQPAVLTWMRGIPDPLRSEKRLFREAFERRFPELAAIPYATDDNLPRWESRMRDPHLAQFLRRALEGRGWLDRIEARASVSAGLDALEGSASGVATAGLPRLRGGRSMLKRTWPGQLMRELTLERRHAVNTPPYLRLARLAVLHRLHGQIDARRPAPVAEARPAAAGPLAR